MSKALCARATARHSNRDKCARELPLRIAPVYAHDGRQTRSAGVWSSMPNLTCVRRFWSRVPSSATICCAKACCTIGCADRDTAAKVNHDRVCINATHRCGHELGTDVGYTRQHRPLSLCQNSTRHLRTALVIPLCGNKNLARICAKIFSRNRRHEMLPRLAVDLSSVRAEEKVRSMQSLSLSLSLSVSTFRLRD
jgi:hypothetical protein